MTLLALCILALFVQRALALWLIGEITKPLREWLMARRGWIGYLAGCPMCLGVWFAAVGYLLWHLGGPVGHAVVTIIALSGASVVVDLLIVGLDWGGRVLGGLAQRTSGTPETR